MSVAALGHMSVLKIAGEVAFAIGALSFGVLFTDKDFLPARLWNRYLMHLDRTQRFLFMPATGKKIANAQIGAMVAVITAVVLVGLPYWYLLVVVILVGPAVYLRQLRAKRIELLEMQVDGFILALANGLKTVPSAGAALQAVVPILRDPTRQEIDRVLKEMRIGATLEQALLNMAVRIGSRSIDAALAAVIVGIQVGGNLPQVLETTASSIREMNRLEGVVRTKTAEGRAQLWVLVAFPFALIYMFNLASPGYFDPLQNSLPGYGVITAATFLWLAAIVIARKILTVDI